MIEMLVRRQPLNCRAVSTGEAEAVCRLISPRRGRGTINWRMLAPCGRRSSDRRAAANHQRARSTSGGLQGEARDGDRRERSFGEGLVGVCDLTRDSACGPSVVCRWVPGGRDADVCAGPHFY